MNPAFTYYSTPYLSQFYQKLFFMFILGLHSVGCTSNDPCGEDEGDCDHEYHCKNNHTCGNDNCRSSVGLEPFYDCCYYEVEDICTTNHPCNIDEGDCDSHEVCQNNLVCGLDNCPESLGHDPDVDCCYKATVGDEDFCTTDNPCGPDEGDCDSNKECQTNHICDTVNSCLLSLGFDSEVNCCIIGCKSQQTISTVWPEFIPPIRKFFTKYTNFLYGKSFIPP